MDHWRRVSEGQSPRRRVPPPIRATGATVILSITSSTAGNPWLLWFALATVGEVYRAIIEFPDYNSQRRGNVSVYMLCNATGIVEVLCASESLIWWTPSGFYVGHGSPRTEKRRFDHSYVLRCLLHKQLSTPRWERTTSEGKMAPYVAPGNMTVLVDNIILKMEFGHRLVVLHRALWSPANWTSRDSDSPITAWTSDKDRTVLSCSVSLLVSAGGGG